jgi:hypothetical protein
MDEGVVKDEKVYKDMSGFTWTTDAGRLFGASLSDRGTR